MHPDFHHYVNLVWIGLLLLWVAASFKSHKTIRTQSPRSRLAQSAMVLAAFVLLFTPRFRTSALSWRFVPDSALTGLIGFILTLAGGAFAVWGRLTLGKIWSARVTIKENHKLVRTGPYALVRHPIYAGGLLALLGTAIVVGELRGLVAVFLALTGWWFKSRLEEAVMLEHFDVEYLDYKKKVKALVPFIL